MELDFEEGRRSVLDSGTFPQVLDGGAHLLGGPAPGSELVGGTQAGGAVFQNHSPPSTGHGVSQTRAPGDPRDKWQYPRGLGGQDRNVGERTSQREVLTTGQRTRPRDECHQRCPASSPLACEPRLVKEASLGFHSHVVAIAGFGPASELPNGVKAWLWVRQGHSREGSAWTGPGRG